MHPALLDSSFLIDLEREIQAGIAGKAIEWLRRECGKKQRALFVTSVSAAEFLEGCEDTERGLEFLSHYIPQGIGSQHSTKCAEIQRRAAKRGSRFSEDDAWQIAFAECAKASIVARDTKAFTHLGDRYEQF